MPLLINDVGKAYQNLRQMSVPRWGIWRKRSYFPPGGQFFWRN